MSISKLNAENILRRVIDETNNALKTIPSGATAFSVELNAADGDSVLSIPNSLSSKSELSTESGVVVAALSCVGIKSISMHTKTTSNITTPHLLTLEFSPSDVDDIWIATSVTLTPSSTSGNIVSATPISNLLARRVRVSTALANSDGTFDLYIIGHTI